MIKGSKRGPRKITPDTVKNYYNGWEKAFGNKDKDSTDDSGDQCDNSPQGVDDEEAEADETPWCCRPQIPRRHAGCQDRGTRVLW